MGGLTPIELVWICAISGVLGLAIALVTLPLLAQRASLPAPIIDFPTLRFEMDSKGNILHTNLAAREFLTALDVTTRSFSDLKELFGVRFTGLASLAFADALQAPQFLPTAQQNDPCELHIRRTASGLAIEILCLGVIPAVDAADLHSRFTRDPGDRTALDATHLSATPMWSTANDGTVLWSNPAYDALQEDIEPNPLSPDAPLIAFPAELSPGEVNFRTSVSNKTRNKTYWFDVTSMDRRGTRLNYASDIHAVINAETAQRNFVQTLAKTFAQLSIGLAIFDRNRQLVLFNPALIDLITLPADFLANRPNLFSFFDRMRDKHIMPEPKSYSSWRDRMAHMVSAASSGNFCETWNLPNGLTYRVTGRPHPDGAIAFLFEDISAEISLTRRFRAEIEVHLSALDALDDAVSVFSNTARLTYANPAFRRLWGYDTTDPLRDTAALDITQVWSTLCTPSPDFGDIRAFFTGQSERASWRNTLQHVHEGPIEVHVTPLSHGASMVIFRKCKAAPTRISSIVAAE